MEASTKTVGLLADPGVPERVATKIAGDLAERISREAGQPWHVEVSEETLPLEPDGNIHLSKHAPMLRRRHDWDYVVYLTDLPRYVNQQPMLCQVTPDVFAIMISLPPLGGVRIATRTRDLVLTLLRAATVAGGRPDSSAVEAAAGGADVRAISPDDDSSIVVLTSRFAPLRMLGGMLRSNRPGGLLPALKGSIAAAVATGAFGVFYGTIAALADALPAPRLTMISILVIGALSAWLIVSNSLWNRRGRVPGGGDWRRVLDNASTAVTVGVSVLLMYVVLFAVMLTISLAVIESSYLESQIMRPAGFMQYVDLAWLAASLGTMAGALGSSFDSDEAIREATYSQRYHERRKMFDTYEDRPDNP